MTEVARLAVTIDSRGARVGADQVVAATEKIRRKTKTSFDGMAQASKKATGSIGRLETSLNKAAIAAGAFFGIRAAVRLAVATVKLADSMKLTVNQLQVVARENENVAETQERLLDIANDTRVSFEGTVNLYARVARGTRELNITQREQLDITGAINQSFLISGQTAREASQSVIQFGQALVSNRLGGDELRSVTEQADRLVRALIDGLNVTKKLGPVSRTNFRALAEAGKFTTDVIVEALQTQIPTLQAEFEQLSITAAQGFQRAKNSFGFLIKDIDEGLGVTNEFARIFTNMSNNINNARFTLFAPEELEMGNLMAVPGALSDARTELDALIAQFPILADALTMPEQSGGGGLKILGSLEQAQIRAVELRTQIRKLEGELQAAGEAASMLFASEESRGREALLPKKLITKMDVRRRKDQLREEAKTSGKTIEDMGRGGDKTFDFTAGLGRGGEEFLKTQKKMDEAFDRLTEDFADFKQGTADAQQQLEAFTQGGESLLRTTELSQEARDLFLEWGNAIGVSEAAILKLLTAEKDALDTIKEMRDTQQEIAQLEDQRDKLLTGFEGKLDSQLVSLQAQLTGDESIVAMAQIRQQLEGFVSDEKLTQLGLSVELNNLTTGEVDSLQIKLDRIKEITAELAKQRDIERAVEEVQEAHTPAFVASERTIDLARAGGASEAEIASFVAQLSTVDKELVEIEDGLDRIKDAGEAAAASLADAFGTLITSTDSLTDQLLNLLSVLSKIGVESFVTGPLESGLSSLFSAGSSGLASMFGGGGGGGAVGGAATVLGGALAGGLAHGGPAASGRPYLVGEQGPELFIPGASGRVVSSDTTAAMLGGGGNVTVNIAGGISNSGRKTPAQAAAEIGSMTSKQLRRNR